MGDLVDVRVQLHVVNRFLLVWFPLCDTVVSKIAIVVEVVEVLDHAVDGLWLAILELDHALGVFAERSGQAALKPLRVRGDEAAVEL